MFSLPLEKVLWAEVLARVWDQVLEAASVIMLESRLEAVIMHKKGRKGLGMPRQIHLVSLS